MSPQDATPSQTHENAAPQTVEQKADAFMKRIRDHDDVSTQGGGMPPSDATTLHKQKDNSEAYEPLDKATFDLLVKRGDIVELKKGELAPAASSWASEKPDGHYSPPVYVVPAAAQDKYEIQPVGVQGGETIYIASERNHVWNEDYVRQNIMFSNADIKNDPAAVHADRYKPPAGDAARYQELLAHEKDTARREGNSPAPIVLVNTSPDAPDITSQQSREGQEYIYVSQKRLDAALATREDTNKLKQDMDAEQDRIQRGDNSPKGLMMAKEERGFVSSFYIKNDGTYETPTLPMLDQRVSNDALEHMAKDGTLIKVSPDELTASAGKDPIFKDKDGHDLPVYILPGSGGIDSNIRGGMKMKTAEGQEYVLINEGYHKQTPDYVRKYDMNTDADMVGSANFKKAEDYKPAPDDAGRYQAFIAEVTREGTKDGKPPRIIIDSGAHAPPAYSEQSAEGNNYIFVSQKELDKALENPKDMEQLKGRLNDEYKVIQNGDNSPEGILRAREANDFMNTFESSKDNHLELPADNVRISSGALKVLSDSGSLTEVPRSDLLPETTKDPVFSTKDAQGKDLPVYVVTGDAGRDTDGSEPRAKVMHTSDGKEYILMNEANHKWTEDYVRQNMMTPNSEITGARATHKLSSAEGYLDSPQAQLPREPHHTYTPEEQARYEKLTSFLKERAKAEGHGDVEILIDNTSNSKYAGTEASAMETQEGKKYIILDRQQLRDALSSDEKMDQMRGVASHEVTHFSDGDAGPQGVIKTHNNLDAYKNDEYLADLKGFGPQGSRNPEAMAKLDEQYIRDDIQYYNANHLNAKISEKAPSDKDLKTVSDWQHQSEDPKHPSLYERVQVNRDEAAVMKAYEADFQKKNGHAPTSPQELQDEEKAVIRQVILDMKAKGIVITDDSDTKAGAATQQDTIKAAQNAVGHQALEDASTPAAPTAAMAKAQQPAAAQRQA